MTIPWVEVARRTIKWLEENEQLENSEDFPFYDQIIKAWRQAIESLTIKKVVFLASPSPSKNPGGELCCQDFAY